MGRAGNRLLRGRRSGRLHRRPGWSDRDPARRRRVPAQAHHAATALSRGGKEKPGNARLFAGRVPRLRGRLHPRAFALAPPPAKAGGGWEGVLTVRADPEDTTPQPSPAFAGEGAKLAAERSEEHTSQLPSLMRISYAVSTLKHKQFYHTTTTLKITTLQNK